MDLIESWHMDVTCIISVPYCKVTLNSLHKTNARKSTSNFLVNQQFWLKNAWLFYHQDSGTEKKKCKCTTIVFVARKMITGDNYFPIIK